MSNQSFENRLRKAELQIKTLYATLTMTAAEAALALNALRMGDEEAFATHLHEMTEVGNVLQDGDGRGG